MEKKILEVEYLKKYLTYHPDLGIFTSNVKRLRYIDGEPVGYTKKNGYIEIYLNGGYHYAHRLAWLYMTGEFPIDNIDHLDGNPQNNKWKNLRLANQSINTKNQKSKKSNKTGKIGVFYRKDREKWIAYIKVDYKRINLGTFLNFEDAATARVQAEQKYGFISRDDFNLKNNIN